MAMSVNSLETSASRTAMWESNQARLVSSWAKSVNILVMLENSEVTSANMRDLLENSGEM